MSGNGTLTDRLAEDLHGAFPALVRSELDVVYTALFRAGGSRVDAEDIAQETFMRAYSALGGYLPDRIRELRLRSWLLTIAMNLWRNELRRRSRHPLVDGERQEESDVHIGPEDEALRGEERGELATLVGSLPEIYREPVVLRHIVDLPLTEIAEILQRPTGTVKAQVSRGLALLRRNLEDHEMEEAR